MGSIVGYQQKCYQKKKSQKVAKMGQNYAKYCHISGMLKDPVETFETSRTYREAIHGPSDFILMVKGIQFNCHKTVLMTTSRYFDTMLTLFDERSKSEVELKDSVDPRSSSSHVFTIPESTNFFFSQNLLCFVFSTR